MGKSTTKLVFEGDVGDAILGIVKLVEKMKDVKGEVKDFGKVSKDTDILGNSINNAANSAKNFIGAFFGITGIVAAIKSAVDYMKEVVVQQNKLATTAETVEQMGLKLAALRGDVSKAGVGKVISEATTRGVSFGIPLQLSSQIGLSTETNMGRGTAGAKQAADTIAKFAGPMGLQESEIDNLSRLFQLEGATTKESQERIVNKLIAAQQGSKTTMGQFITPFVSGYVAEKRKGIGLDQALAMNTAAIEATGSVGEASNAQEMMIRMLTEPSALGFKFLKGQGRREGVNYMGLDTTERIEFGRAEYEKYKEAGQLDIFRTKMGMRAAGFEGVERMFSPAAQTKQAETLAAVQHETNMINKLAAAYGELAIKKAASETTAELGGHYDRGEAFESQKNITERAKAAVARQTAESTGIFAKAADWILPEWIKERIHKQAIIENQLIDARANAPAGSEKQKQISKLAVQDTFWHVNNPEYLDQVAKITGDFGLAVQAMNDQTKAIGELVKVIKDTNNTSAGAGPHIETRE